MENQTIVIVVQAKDNPVSVVNIIRFKVEIGPNATIKLSQID